MAHKVFAFFMDVDIFVIGGKVHKFSTEVRDGKENKKT